MVRKVKASRLYKEGRFNYANLRPQADGSIVYVCDGPRAPAPFSFRARDFLTAEEELLEDPEVVVRGD